MQKQGQILFIIHRFGEHKLNVKQVSPWPISLRKPNSNRNLYSLLPIIHFASLPIGSHKQKRWVGVSNNGTFSLRHPHTLLFISLVIFRHSD